MSAEGWARWLADWRKSPERSPEIERASRRREDPDLVLVLDAWQTLGIGWDLEAEPWASTDPAELADPWAWAWSEIVPSALAVLTSTVWLIGVDPAVAAARFRAAISWRLIAPDGSLTRAGQVCCADPE